MEFVEKFQSGIVGLLGFVGVIITLIVNAKFAREERQEARKHDRDALTTALTEELRLVKLAFQDRVDTIVKAEADKSEGIMVPLDSMTEAYDHFVPRLGLLSRKQVEKVMAAYLSVKQVPAKITLIGAKYGDGSPYVEVGTQFFEIIKGMHFNILPIIDAAIMSLESD